MDVCIDRQLNTPEDNLLSDLVDSLEIQLERQTIIIVLHTQLYLAIVDTMTCI